MVSRDTACRLAGGAQQGGSQAQPLSGVRDPGGSHISLGLCHLIFTITLGGRYSYYQPISEKRTLKLKEETIPGHQWARI